MQLHGHPHVLLQLNDVTRQREAEEQTRQGMKLEAIGRLAAGVAHDFNNILTVIKGHASLLLGDESIPANAQRAIEQMADASRRATGLVRQLLAFGRQQVINPRPIDVGQHIESESRMLIRLIGERIALRWDTQPSMPPALVDPGSLDQVLLNLVVNARDAMPNGGSVTITACTARIDEDYCVNIADARPGDYILIKVADTGTGIPLEIQSRIFEPFFSTKDESRGTGLGLATVHGLVKQQGGWLELQSKPGSGSTFSIYLPQTVATADVQRSNTEPLRPADWKIGGGRAALIVEDDETIRIVLRQLLARFGFDLLEAANGLQALDIWQQKMQDIQLVVTDVVMPGSMSGLDLGQRISADKPRVKIIYCTGYSAEMVSGNSGITMVEGQNFLAKPYDAQSLLQILNRLFPRKGGKPATTRLTKRTGTTSPLVKEPALTEA
jgi:nitrogen-specific signal transduction histidine kinase/ActR/RegA family two-component response regulator